MGLHAHSGPMHEVILGAVPDQSTHSCVQFTDGLHLHHSGSHTLSDQYAPLSLVVVSLLPVCLGEHYYGFAADMQHRCTCDLYSSLLTRWLLCRDSISSHMTLTDSSFEDTADRLLVRPSSVALLETQSLMMSITLHKLAAVDPGKEHQL